MTGVYRNEDYDQILVLPFAWQKHGRAVQRFNHQSELSILTSVSKKH